MTKEEVSEIDCILETIRDLDTDSAEKMLMALKSKALAQPAQEPVAWMPIESAPKDGTMILVKLPRMMNLVVRARYNTIHKFWMNDYEGEGGIINPYYYHEGDLWHPIPTDTHPAPEVALAPEVKQWQGLSDYDILSIDGLDCVDENNLIIFARAIEQALKEKNHG